MIESTKKKTSVLIEVTERDYFDKLYRLFNMSPDYFIQDNKLCTYNDDAMDEEDDDIIELSDEPSDIKVFKAIKYLENIKFKYE